MRVVVKVDDKRDLIRKILETWTERDLREVILNAFPRKRDMIDFIMDEDLLADDFDEIIRQEMAEKAPAVMRLVAANEAELARTSPHQDCIHLDFDPLGNCRMCRREQSECEVMA
jgi:hypothetical protein